MLNTVSMTVEITVESQFSTPVSEGLPEPVGWLELPPDVSSKRR